MGQTVGRGLFVTRAFLVQTQWHEVGNLPMKPVPPRTTEPDTRAVGRGGGSYTRLLTRLA